MVQSGTQREESVRRLAAWAAAGFAAGFVSTLVFHQPVLAVLHGLGLTNRTAFRFVLVPPLGLPDILSLAFWGGLWGSALAVAQHRLGRCRGDFGSALLLGAIVPSLGTWFVSAPLHGYGLGGGWYGAEMLTSLLVNAAWGLGTALLLRRLPGAGSLSRQ
ncbi:hypothetical protein HQ394_04365 [Defluviicoccus vanus]|uniref:Uncharacterized protein n=2 Tax=Defluviicoccus vanus TaxID=111831 RepID=A0A7H1MZ57_9PROT|nr:hypothetical protein HQ394_04365 [Defluviicoccus vanus]